MAHFYILSLSLGRAFLVMKELCIFMLPPIIKFVLPYCCRTVALLTGRPCFNMSLVLFWVITISYRYICFHSNCYWRSIVADGLITHIMGRYTGSTFVNFENLCVPFHVVKAGEFEIRTFQLVSSRFITKLHMDRHDLSIE